MPTIRGFVEKLEIGRAGLATASLLHDDGSRATYAIPDLDADPERFNERLSKLGILRDAQNRAEPVEVEYSGDGGNRIIERVARITRDTLDTGGKIVSVKGMIVGVVVLAQNLTGAQVESADIAQVFMLPESGAAQNYFLSLQIPERSVAEAQLAMIRAAQATGESLTLFVDSANRRITGVQSGGPVEDAGSPDRQIIDGFVESVAHAPVPGGLAGTAVVEFTTAPPFTEPGHVVTLIPFAPALRAFLVVLGSPEYELFLAGLRDKLRMRVFATARGDRKESDPPPKDNPSLAPNVRGSAQPAAAVKSATPVMLVRGAQLLHALASASRPVWIQVSRKSLDVGPDARCTEGLPASDLTPSGLRDLHIPYTAEWLGFGCFNHGVYRFQFDFEFPFEISVDGKVLCVHASADGKTQFAHACLESEHEVRVTLPGWTCDREFTMDVYRIR